LRNGKEEKFYVEPETIELLAFCPTSICAGSGGTEGSTSDYKDSDLGDGGGNDW